MLVATPLVLLALNPERPDSKIVLKRDGRWLKSVKSARFVITQE
jgi:thiol:disulfide interchange protein